MKNKNLHLKPILKIANHTDQKQVKKRFGNGAKMGEV
jgi:hypothetical protein